MMAIWCEGDDPKKFGFNYTSEIFDKIKKFVLVDYEFNSIIVKQWLPIKLAFIRNKTVLKVKSYYNKIKWIKNFDFNHPRRNYLYLYKCFRQKIHLYKSRIMKFIYYLRYTSKRNRIFLFNTPTHGN